MQVLRDLAIALSLANLYFFSVWSDLLPNPPRHYHFPAPPHPLPFIAIMLNVLVLAILFWGGAVFARRSRQTLVLDLARWIFLAVFVVALIGLYQKILAHFQTDPSTLIGETGSAVLGVMLAGIILFVLIRWRHQVIYAATTLVLVLFPFVLVTFSRAGWALIDRESAFAGFAQEPLASPLEDARPLPRVLWLIFDELDQRLTFLERPSTVKLPELDRFRGQALFASNAYPPAGRTLLSMPALITGKLVSKAQPARADELMVTFADEKDPVSWGSQPNIFSKTRDLGFNTAALGWYHPYCRVFGHSLTNCVFYGWWEKDILELEVFETLSDQIARSLQAVPLAEQLHLEQRVRRLLESPSMVAKRREMAVGRYLDMLEDAKKTVTSSDFGLTLLHWPIPHPYGIYNRVKKNLAWNEEGSYLDNLELVDRTLGELRSLMETAGIWQNTAVLITSDHAYRINVWKSRMKSEESAAVAGKEDHRVPFLLKLAGQETAVTYDPPFNTILIHDIILALLHGKISDPDSLITWLDQHRSIGQSPYDILE
jgi:sulfatase-like protein